MFGGAIRMGYGETVFQAVAGSRVVGRIVDFLIYNGLDGGSWVV